LLSTFEPKTIIAGNVTSPLNHMTANNETRDEKTYSNPK
jgi:hypothetical protein